MRVQLEVFAVCPDGSSLRYKVAQWDISQSDEDPNNQVSAQLESFTGCSLSEGDVLIHSTSWRFAPPNGIFLTYLCYSEKFQPDSGWESLSLTGVDAAKGKRLSGDTSGAEVLAHGLRHLAFLIKNGDLSADGGPACESATGTLSPLTSEVAGRI